jgi:hypothetical protein
MMKRLPAPLECDLDEAKPLGQVIADRRHTVSICSRS